VLPDPFRGMGPWRNSTETHQSGRSQRSGPEVKNGRSGAEDGASERLGCGTVKEKIYACRFNSENLGKYRFLKVKLAKSNYISVKLAQIYLSRLIECLLSNIGTKLY